MAPRTPTRFVFYSVLAVACLWLADVAAVVKRSDDFPGMAVIEQLASRVQILEATLAATRGIVDRLDTLVAFEAKLRAGIDTTGPGLRITLDDVILNRGGGYDAITGIFTAPVSGTYAFYVKTESEAGKPLSLELMHNGASIGHVYGDDTDSYDMVSTQEVTQAAKGDRFWITSGTPPVHFRGSGPTRFVGFLIHAD